MIHHQKILSFFFFWKQHVKVVQTFRHWNEVIHPDRFEFRKYKRNRVLIRGGFFKKNPINLLSVVIQDLNFIDIPIFISKGFNFYSKYRKFFDYKATSEAIYNFSPEIKKFEQLHFYKELNTFKLLDTRHYSENQHYYPYEKEVIKINIFYSFLKKLYPNKYTNTKINFFFEDSETFSSKKADCKEELDYILNLKKTEQSKKLVSFFYKHRRNYWFNKKYKNLSKSFLNSSFGSCLNNFEKKNKINCFFAEPLLKRKSTYFEIIIGFIFMIIKFILSIPGRIFTFFVEEIPYKAIFLYVWWLVKGVFNFSHLDRYIYGPTIIKYKFRKKYFIESFYLRRQLKNSIDLDVLIDTKDSRPFYDESLYGVLKQTYKSKASFYEKMYYKVLSVYSPYYFRGDEKLGEDCLLKTPPVHETKIWTNKFYRTNHKIMRLRTERGIRKVLMKQKTIRFKANHEESWINKIRLNRRIKKVDLKIKSKNEK